MPVKEINIPMEQDSPGVNLMPPAVLLTALLAGGVLEYFFPTALPCLPPGVAIISGTLIAGAGFAFMMMAHELFKRVGTNVPTNLPATELVERGAYRFSRNPMYVGMLAFFAGLGMAVNSLWITGASLPLMIYFSKYVIPREEMYLERIFGENYRDYSGRVRRWL